MKVTGKIPPLLWREFNQVFKLGTNPPLEKALSSSTRITGRVEIKPFLLKSQKFLSPWEKFLAKDILKRHNLTIALPTINHEVFKQYSAELRPIIAKAKRLNPRLDEKVIWQAFNLAHIVYAGKTRESGDPAISHPVGVFRILAEEFKYADTATLVAALLHDVLEDTAETTEVRSYENIKNQFGLAIVGLVTALTKLRGMGHRYSREESDKELLRQLFSTMATDIRVALIKLADRKHNMTTLESLSRESQLRNAAETMNIYAPLAARLGLWELMRELQDLAFSYLEPQKYAGIEGEATVVKGVEAIKVEALIAKLRRILIESGKVKVDNLEIRPRFKNITTMAKETIHYLGYPITLNAIQLIFENEDDCFTAERIIHASEKITFRQHRIRHYFGASRKFGIYSSLHTMLVEPYFGLVRLQLRTGQWDWEARLGIVEDLKKATPDPQTEKPRLSNAWINQLSVWAEKDLKMANDVVKKVKDTLGANNIMVRGVGWEGKAKEIPEGATVLDFFIKYRGIDSITHFVGIDYRDRWENVTLGHILKDGDFVVMQPPSQKSPSLTPNLEWLKWVRTDEAKEIIKGYLRARQAEEVSHQNGQKALAEAFWRSGYLKLEDVLSLPYFREFLAQLKVPEIGDSLFPLEHLFYALGVGDILAGEVVEAFADYYQQYLARSGKNRRYLIKVDIKAAGGKSGVLNKTSNVIAELKLNIEKGYFEEKYHQAEINLEVAVFDTLQEKQVLSAINSIPEVLTASIVY